LREEVNEQLSLAEECLEEAKLLLASGFYRGAASRAYYSMYHAARALLAARNIAPKKHAGVLRMLGLEFGNKGYLEDTYAEAYKLAFDVRMSADYEGKADIGDELAEQLVKDAEVFVKKAYKVLDQLERN